MHHHYHYWEHRHGFDYYTLQASSPQWGHKQCGHGLLQVVQTQWSPHASPQPGAASSIFSLKMLLTAHKSTWYLGSADERNSSSCGRQKINFVKVEEWSVDAKFTPGPMHTVCNQASGLILVTRSEALRVCPRTQTNDITRKRCCHIRSFPSIDI